MLSKIIVSSDIGQFRETTDNILTDLGLVKNHPDVLRFESGTKVGIKEAKGVKEFFGKKSYYGGANVVIFEDAGYITPDAQNALLKQVEELGEKSLIIFGARSAENLIQTIISRCKIIHLPNSNPLQKDFDEDIKKLMGQDTSHRFVYIERLKDKEEFFLSLISFFRQRLHKEGSGIEFLKILLEAEAWKERNGNLRAILEYLMLNLPEN